MEKTARTMKGVQLVGHGGTDQLIYREDIPVPSPGPRDVLIQVKAAAINNTDLNTRIGWYTKSEGDDTTGWAGNAMRFPRIQGADVCGVVVALGSEVDEDLLHQRVLIEPCLFEANGQSLEQAWYFGSECDGGFAEYTVVAARHAHPVDSQFSDTELASFPCSYSTAENLLTRAKVSREDKVLITGASGGVGSAAIQLAKARGASVVAQTSLTKSKQVEALGADQVVTRETALLELIGPNSIDVVIDLVAGDQWPVLLEVLKPFGRYATAGAIGGAFVTLDVRTLYLKDLSLFGCTVLSPEVFPNLVKRIEANEIQALVSKTYPLQDIVQAQEDFETKQHVGKLVLEIGD